jgi:uncharacterized coiled-coil DUF342 family protein
MKNDLEIRQLQETIIHLREELETARFEERDHIQQAVAAANEEIRQLRACVVELREELVVHEAQYEEKLRVIELQHHRERAELQQTISALREVLERHATGQKNIGNTEAAAASASR